MRSANGTAYCCHSATVYRCSCDCNCCSRSRQWQHHNYNLADSQGQVAAEGLRTTAGLAISVRIWPGSAEGRAARPSAASRNSPAAGWQGRQACCARVPRSAAPTRGVLRSNEEGQGSRGQSGPASSTGDRNPPPGAASSRARSGQRGLRRETSGAAAGGPTRPDGDGQGADESRGGGGRGRGASARDIPQRAY